MLTSGVDNQYWQAEKGSRKEPSRSVVCTINDTPRNMKMRNKTLHSLGINGLTTGGQQPCDICGDRGHTENRTGLTPNSRYFGVSLRRNHCIDSANRQHSFHRLVIVCEAIPNRLPER